MLELVLGFVVGAVLEHFVGVVSRVMNWLQK